MRWYDIDTHGITLIKRASDLIKVTGKSFTEALIFASINPQYDNRMFKELPVQYMKTTSAHVLRF